MIKWDEITEKIDRKAVYQTVCLLLMSWTAFPIIYFMLVKKHKKEVKKDEDMG
jgi:preprotein translocase subunit YajC